MRTIRIALLVVAAIGTVRPAATSAQMASAEPAVRAVIAEQAAAWNRGDLDGSVAIFTDDADWRTIERVMLRGRAEIRAALREWMGPPGDPPRATIRHPTGGTVVRMLNDDVAVADVAVEWHLSPPAGDGRPAAAENLFLVLVRTDGGWRIAHIRNTTNLPPPSSGERT